MTMPVDLPLADIARLCRDYRVSELALFGSVARGEAGPDSDIDFLYVLSDPTIGIGSSSSTTGWPSCWAGTPTR
jgi:predicted nucleotidyltransferase